MTKHREKRDRNALRVVEVAADLFFKQGIVNTTIDQIAEGAGVTRTSIFRYYPSKTEIVTATANHIIAGYIEESRDYYAPIAMLPTGGERVNAYLDVFLDLLDERPHMLSFFFELVRYNLLYDRNRNWAASTDDVFALFRPIQDNIMRSMEAGVADGTIYCSVSHQDFFDTVTCMMLGIYSRLELYDIDNPNAIQPVRRMMQVGIDVIKQYINGVHQ